MKYNRTKVFTIVVWAIAMGMLINAFPLRAQLPNTFPNAGGGGGSAGTVFIANTPAVQGTVSIQAAATLPVTIPTPTYNVLAFPGATFPISGSFSAGTVAVGNTVAIATPTYNVMAFPGATFPISGSFSAGTVQVGNTPGVIVFNTPAAALAQSTSTATTLPNVETTPSTILPALGMGYDSSAGSNAYRAVAVDPSGNQGVNLKNTPAIQGSVSINNTPGVAVQNTVAIATPTYNVAAFLANTPGVAIQNTPAMVIASALATIPVSMGTIGVIVQNTAGAPTNIATPTANFFMNVLVSNTPGFQLVGTPAIQGSVSINNTPGVAVQNTVAIATPTYNVAAFLANTPAIQGSVSVNNTPGVSIQNTPAMVIASVLATMPVALSTTDPCQNPAIAKSFVSLAAPSATTTALVAPSSGKVVYVCGFAFTEPQGVGTVGAQLISASNTPCANPTPITGAFTLGITHPAGYSVASTSSGNALCFKTTGAGVDAEGVLSYVQQ